MNIYNYYWYFKSAVPPKICDDIIKYGLTQADTMAITGGYEDKKLTKDQVRDIKRKRNSDLVWLNDTWIYKELHPYIHEANKAAGWNFEWDRSESCQFTKYKLNQYYDWHCDGWDKPYEKKGPKGSIIVFPSFVWHRVKPVTKGTRYSLVMWNLGYPFK
jgi:PKHD-type hydroxylase